MAVRQGKILIVVSLFLLFIFISCDERQTFQPIEPVDILLHGKVTDDREVPLANVEVSVYSTDAPIGTGAAEITTLTDGNGEWEGIVSITISGRYKIAVSRTGYIDAVSDILVFFAESDSIDAGVIALPATDFDDEFRIVLTWGSNPSDLDAHLTGPAGDGSNFHIYWENRRAYTTDEELIAELIHDRRGGYGPETVAIKKLLPGTYRYTVHNYSANEVENDSLLVTRSNARVRIFDGAGVVKEFSISGDEEPETTLGNAWQVFEIDGETGNIVPINKMMDGVRFDDDTVFRLDKKPYGVSAGF